jgi:hypothetical protein
MDLRFTAMRPSAVGACGVAAATGDLRIHWNFNSVARQPRTDRCSPYAATRPRECRRWARASTSGLAVVDAWIKA